ncbi:M23 family metallopeptidase [Neolewinella antarctica]|uniref:M23ase beta-sheet core domain-containing protein n=1 Tax=Neolewinella antarctica TaxID=442734 RepID=A0ABX0XG15_9BACT|nr:M23 family metallopeptidase [Neolewinella antarctica]NJC28147.1 hypothetical protein [Neolewinella antarctica]
MRRDKFVFNQTTLQYDRVVEPLRYTFLRYGALLCAILLVAGLFTVLIHRYFPSPSERMAHQENDIMQDQLAEMRGELELYSSVLSNIQERDASAHRVVFGMEPIDEDVWTGGRGGHEVYEDLKSLPMAGGKLATMRTKMDRFKHQLDLQSRSLDSILLMAEQKEEMLAAIPSIKPIRRDLYSRNIENLSGFGFRLHPIHKVQKMHYGIDFNCKEGTPIQATGKGKVIWSGKRGDYGNCVVIDHGFGYESLYGHMNKIDVKRGDSIEKGAKIGEVGSTGSSTGDHLHYEIHKDGERVDPIQYCYDGLTTEEYAALVKASQQNNMSFDSH